MSEKILALPEDAFERVGATLVALISCAGKPIDKITAKLNCVSVVPLKPFARRMTVRRQVERLLGKFNL